MDDVFDHPAFADLKRSAAAFAVVRPALRQLVWANRTAVEFWRRPADGLGSALFGPAGGGWLGSAMSAVVPGRPPQVYRTGLAPGLGMRGAMVLARALAGPDGSSIVGFAVPASGRAGTSEGTWRDGAGLPAVEEPEFAPSPDQAATGDGAGDAGADLARRGQLAVLRDRLTAATGGQAQPRFLWRTDAQGVLSAIDETVPVRLGAPLATNTEPLPAAVARFDAAAGERLGEALAARATWSGIAVRLPVAAGAGVVPTTLSASPVFGRDRGFEGFRGFGVVDLASLESRPPEARPVVAALDPGGADEPPATTVTDEGLAPITSLNAAPFADDAAGADEAAPPAATPDAAGGIGDPAESLRAGPTAFANVVDLREFQAVRSASPTGQETGGSKAAEPAAVPDAPTGEEEPVSDEVAFLALGAALRAQMGEAEPVVPPHAPGPTEFAAPAAAPEGAGTVNPGAPVRPAADTFASLLDRLPAPILVLRGDEAVFANAAAAQALGFKAPGDLIGSASPVAADGERPGLTLRKPGGDAMVIPADPVPVDWHGAEATLWTLRAGPAESPPDPARPAPTAPPEAEERSVDLIDRVDDAVALLDGEGRIRRLNERGRAWFDGGALGEEVTTLLAPESRPAGLQLLEEARSRGERSPAPPPRREVTARTAQGVLMPMLLTLGRLGSTGYYATLRDVSTPGRAERDDAPSRGDQGRDAGRLPDLLARVSHEIRTPLNAILGFAEVMMDERLGPLGNPRYRDYLKDIHASGTQVVTLVDDLLDLSRIEAGRVELEVGAVDVNKIVAEIVAQMQPEANRERVIVRTSLASRVPPVLADERSARQIVQHLLSNAVKFNEPGGQVIVSTAQDEGGAVLLRIRDTGVGMTEVEIAAALEPFHDVSPPRPANGNGLGLPLARALIGANGASLSIRSRPREGTLVEVSFPPASSEASRRPA